MNIIRVYVHLYHIGLFTVSCNEYSFMDVFWLISLVKPLPFNINNYILNLHRART